MAPEPRCAGEDANAAAAGLGLGRLEVEAIDAGRNVWCDFAACEVGNLAPSGLVGRADAGLDLRSAVEAPVILAPFVGAGGRAGRACIRNRASCAGVIIGGVGLVG
ncbi:MAG: hypothetical protein LBL52_02810 [Rickettsiales bacterium]|nr:hypothetical protein [Rickettsiales bacterium]